MNIEEIRKNAPNGATHYYKNGFFKIEGRCIYSWQTHSKRWHYDGSFHNGLLKPLY